MKVQLIEKNFEEIEYRDLTIGNVYRVIGIEADDYRVVNDAGEPYLYPPDIFAIVDPVEPKEWIVEYGEEGERYAYPSELGGIGFFEDYFDGDPKAIITFRRYVQRLTRGNIPKAA